jgi:signal transduction histidine kinase
MILNEQLPWYAGTILRGEVLRYSRLPGDLPPEATSEREYCIQVGLKSHVMIPLKVRDSVIGAIGFGSFRGYREWPDDLVQRLRLVGDIFTNALAHKRADEALRARERSLRQTRERLRQLAAKLLHAQEEERRRIAREMHDDWTQRLAVLGIDIAKLEQQIGSPEKALPLLRTMQEQLVELSEDVHALSRQLHPSILDDLGLVEALRSECAGFARREAITVEYRPEEVPTALSKDIALCVYRVAQEALRNIAKHAVVNEARVSLVASGPELVLRVEDHGAGFDPAGVRARPGLGLSSMEERVRLVGAELCVTSAPGRGTTVVVRIPLASGDP